MVCHSFKNLIENDRQWLIFQLEHIHNQEKTFIDYDSEDKPNIKSSIKTRFPEWNAFIEKVSKRQNIPVLKEFVNFMWIYFKDEFMSYCRNPLHTAVATSNIEFTQFLINNGIDLEMKNPNGYTPLHTACVHDKIKMVQLLIKHQPTFDASSRTNDGRTIFHCAVGNSDPQVPKLILDTFRFEDIRCNPHGFTMLHFAVFYGPKETIEFLMESKDKFGINLEERTNHGRTILHLACQKRDIEIVDLIHYALEKFNIDIDFGTSDYHHQATPLHYACSNKTSDVAIHLLQRFPDKINVLGPNDKHVLHYACKYGHLELLKYIFGNQDFDIDFNITTQDGDTPLHIACNNGHFEVVKFLLENSKEKGIDIFKKANDQMTAEDLAKEEGHNNILELLEAWTLQKTIEATKAKLKADESRFETLRKKHNL